MAERPAPTWTRSERPDGHRSLWVHVGRWITLAAHNDDLDLHIHGGVRVIGNPHEVLDEARDVPLPRPDAGGPGVDARCAMKRQPPPDTTPLDHARRAWCDHMATCSTCAAGRPCLVGDPLDKAVGRAASDDLPWSDHAVSTST